jgi:Delta7-sterol 5-desaturase
VSPLDFKGQTYSSSFDALLQGKPLDNPCRNFNAYFNSFIFSSQHAGFIFTNMGMTWGHYFMCYLRNLIAGVLVYYGTAGFFHYHIYIHPRAQSTFQDRTRPTWDTIKGQIKLSQQSLFVYVSLPVIDEFLVEGGYTKVYFTIDEVGGWIPFTLYTILYFSFVEIGIYWMHRTLHTNKWLYKHVHLMHHQYNKPETLTPWASIAFHPLDGMLQACPYVVCLFLVPCHYLTHVLMLFFTAVWATYIHDAMDWNVDPIMGSKYHTVHHTHYIYNYGQMLTFCDRFWGTFKMPDGPTGVKRVRVTKKIE